MPSSHLLIDHHSMSSKQPKAPIVHPPFRCLDLMPEIRNLIYTYAFASNDFPKHASIWLEHIHTIHRHRLCHPLPLTNRQIRHETLQLYRDWIAPFWQHNTFRISLNNNSAATPQGFDRANETLAATKRELRRLKALCGSGMDLRREVRICVGVSDTRRVPAALGERMNRKDWPSVIHFEVFVRLPGNEGWGLKMYDAHTRRYGQLMSLQNHAEVREILGELDGLVTRGQEGGREEHAADVLLRWVEAVERLFFGHVEGAMGVVEAREKFFAGLWGLPLAIEDGSG